MFAGITSDIGRVRTVHRTNRDLRLEIESALDFSDAAIGASILNNGCCLTVVGIGQGSFEVEATNETLACSTVGDWMAGTQINLKRPQRLNGELGGHIVSGHVDAVGEVSALVPDGGAHRLRVRVPAPLHRFIAKKGAIAVDGVSLTVTESEGDEFEVCLIPHTWDTTRLKDLVPGSRVNIEIDILARYMARWLETSKDDAHLR